MALVRLLAFVPYVVVSVIHLTALYVGSEGVAGPTKVLLMPALLVALFGQLPRVRWIVVMWLTVATIFLWVGDWLFALPGEIGFLLALGAFFFAHVAHLALFRWPLRRRGLTWWAFAYLAWWLALMLVLGPHLGVLIVPVAIYGVVLGAAAAFALVTNPITAIGAFLFLVSDSILAFKLFWPGFAIWQQDAIIMVLYLAGQGLIVYGALRQGMRVRRTPVTPEPVPAS